MKLKMEIAKRKKEMYKQLHKIEKLHKKLGYKWNLDIRINLLQYCMLNEIVPEYIFAVYCELMKKNKF